MPQLILGRLRMPITAVLSTTSDDSPPHVCFVGDMTMLVPYGCSTFSSQLLDHDLRAGRLMEPQTLCQ
jgi:hypothetical protein